MTHGRGRRAGIAGIAGDQHKRPPRHIDRTPPAVRRRHRPSRHRRRRAAQQTNALLAAGKQKVLTTQLPAGHNRRVQPNRLDANLSWIEALIGRLNAHARHAVGHLDAPSDPHLPLLMLQNDQDALAGFINPDQRLERGPPERHLLGRLVTFEQHAIGHAAVIEPPQRPLDGWNPSQRSVGLQLILSPRPRQMNDPPTQRRNNAHLDMFSANGQQRPPPPPAANVHRHLRPDRPRSRSQHRQQNCKVNS